jgi:hypothetical protein
MLIPSVRTVISLYTAIKELQDEAENSDSIFNRSGAGKKKKLAVLVQNCNAVLQQLNNLLIKYKSLGTKSKRTWDRLKWGTENLAEIREKIMSHTSSLTLFLMTLSAGSLGRIEKKLDQLIEDVRAGKREETVLTMADNDYDDAEIQWDLWKREMLDDGFTKVELEGHKDWIKARLMELIESGGLHEEPLLEKAGTSKPSLTSSSRKAALEKSNVSHLSNNPKSGAASAKRAAFQAKVGDADGDAEDLEERENQEALLKYSRKSEPKNNSGEEVDCEEKSGRIPNSTGSDASDSIDDTFLPTDSISNGGINTTGIPSAPDIRTSESDGGFSFSKPESIFAEFLRNQADLGGTDGFDDIFGASGPIGATWYTPSPRTPPPISENNVIEKHLLLTLEELFKGTHKKIKVKNKKNLRETVCEMDVKPGLKKGTKFKFKNLGDLEDGGQQDLHIIIEEVSLPCQEAFALPIS